MLLNFSNPEVAPTYQPKFKGGSWRQRLVAKRSANRRQQRKAQFNPGEGEEYIGPSQHIAVHTHGEPEFPHQRPIKRRRENGDFTPASSSAAVSMRYGTAVQDQLKSRNVSQPREIISSLFSYNPKPTTTPEQPSEPINEVQAQPSNAPLVDGADTFASLGLSNALSNHLVTKLGLKHPTAIQKSSISQLLQEDSDAFIQSETGSGKTLAYVLPLIQRLMSLSATKDIHEKEVSRNSAINRDSGLFAIILAPTRELCKQISVVLERLLRCAHWLVAGTVIGGEKKKSEKARLRKGLNILVATPGRLADHLENTEVLDVSNVRWLVLDEGDRLMDLGFEDEIQKIVKKLDEGQKQSEIIGLPRKRTTVLCSATMKMNVQRLGEISLSDAALIKPDANSDDTNPQSLSQPESTFYAPAQLKQSYTIVAAKLRLVTLTALLKRTFTRKGSVMKAIVFLSCADSVDFHYDVFTRPLADEEASDTTPPSTPPPAATETTTSKPDLPFAPSPHLSSSSSLSSTPSTSPTIYKIHGSLPQQTRTAILHHFTNSTTPSLLLSTDLASRGLDLPNLDLVIEYDPAFSSDDHLHRIGRTARLGRDGRTIIFLLPGSEEGYVEVLRQAYHPSSSSEGLLSTNVSHMPCEEILKRGFSSSSPTTTTSTLSKTKSRSASAADAANWESLATSYQLSIERWVLSSPRNKDLAKRAFQSHVRAYATHIAKERKYFDIKDLHLGHLAKGFGLRDRPGGIGVGRNGKGVAQGGGGRRKRVGAGGVGEDGENRTAKEVGVDDAAEKMRRKMKEMVKSGAGAGEFNIA